MSHRRLALLAAMVWAVSCTGEVGQPPLSHGAPCVTDGECDDDNLCTSDRCNQATGFCEQAAVADFVLEDAEPGDCSVSACLGGALANQPDDGDVPADDNPCTQDVCNDGVAANLPAVAGTPCGDSVECDGTGLCVGCIAPDECPQPGNPCQAATCVGEVCGVANADGTLCTGDGIFCNGDEVCQGGSCTSPGDPCDGPGDADGDCSETCDETANDCTGDDPNNSNCDDGLWCTGTDQCNPNGLCNKHDNEPCPGPDGDSNCMESCDEATDTCGVADPPGSSCSDGVFCNGSETCSGGLCTGSTGNPCRGPDGDVDCSESCSESLNNCTANDPDFFDCNGLDDLICCHNGLCSDGGGCL